MRVLILGGTAFTGPHIARELAALGHVVTVFHRDPARPRGGVGAPRTFFEGAGHPPEMPHGVAHLYGDRRRLRDHAAALRGVGADVVLDMLCFSRNDARALLDVFAGGGEGRPRLVVASSQDVYRAFGFVLRKEPGHEPTFAPVTEDSPLRESRFPHGRAEGVSEDDAYDKILAEETLRAGDPGVSILRMPATYGPNDPVQRVWEFLHQMEKKRPAILLNPDYANWRWTHGYAENVAHALALLVTRPEAAGETYNVGEAKTPTVGERAHAIARLARYRGHILALPKDRVPPHLAMAGFDLRQDIVVSSDKIRSHLGFAEVVTVEDGLRKTIDWDRAHPQTYRGLVMPDEAAEDAVLAGLGLTPKKK
jgi:nucleoside-diphosphate-sugar epimerase